MKLHRTGAVALAGVALAAVVSGGTYAAWASTASSDNVSLHFGTLNLHEVAGPGGIEGPVWTDISQPSAPVTIDPDTFLVAAGDTLSHQEHFSLDASGDNLTYELGVDWAQAPNLGDNVTGTYSLIADPGTSSETVLVRSKPLGSPAALPVARAGQRTFRLDLTLDYLSDGNGVPVATAGSIYTGEIVLSAHQIREGAQ